MTGPERQILGWCLLHGDIPWQVAAVPCAAWSPDTEFLVRLLVELQSVGVQVGPTDLWRIAQQPATGEIRRVLAAWFSPDDLLLLPQYAPWDVAEVAGLCAVVAERHEARVAYTASLMAAEARVESRRAALQEQATARLAAHWPDLGVAKGTASVPLDLSRVHPGWVAYLRRAA